MPPQPQPQQSGTQTPNGSQTGIPSGGPSVPPGPPQGYAQYPQGMSQQQIYSAQQQAQQQPPTSTVVMPMVPIMPGSGPSPHTMVMSYGGPHQGQNYQMVYTGGHPIYTVQSSYMQPQSQPQQSGTQTPNGSQTGMPTGGPSVQSGSNPGYGQYQQGMQQQPMYSHH
ncbi:hypothetical protein L596_010662 [Steinernema carpocapsae]|uniref:Uncharacterized protein n=1 Tax=Steinernema carpocapsae TaxID=34508 RepID=A0A4U5PJ78_STECR|nr:hypothetical protein L596_010662 [Steinernema carpocapsae]